MSAWQFIVKWFVLIFLVILVARTELGNRIVYWALWLMLLLVLVTHSQDFANVLTPEAAAPPPKK